MHGIAPAEAAPTAARPIRRLRERVLALDTRVVVGLLLLAWAALPILAILGKTLIGDETPTGAYGLVPEDHMQYFAWVREAGDHGLIGNLFGVEDSERVFFHPVYAISGVLWKAGLPLQALPIIWLPVAVTALTLGVVAYAKRFFATGGARWSAIALSLLLAPPLLPLLDALGEGLTNEKLDLLRILGYQLPSAALLWGNLGEVMAIGLLPLVFLAAERAVSGPVERRTKLIAAAAVGGLLASWLHPWQGVTALLVLGGVLAWHRFDRSKWALALIAAVTALPVLYYFVLSRVNDDWELAGSNVTTRPSAAAWVVAAIALSPFLFLAARGLRRPDNVQEKVLILWPVACVVTMVVSDSGWFHSFGGLSLPLAILIVRGWRQLSIVRTLRARGAETAVAACLIAAIAVPALLDRGDLFRDTVDESYFLYHVGADERAMLDFLEDLPQAGSVVATPRFGPVVTAHTGRRSWNGHFAWTPDYDQRENLVRQVMDRQLTKSQSRTALAQTGATFFVADCRFPPAAVADLRGLVTPVRTFGCAGVYRIQARG